MVSEFRGSKFLLLPLRELEAFSSALLSVLLAFLDSGIAGDQTGVFKRLPQVAIILEQRASDAVTNRSRLAGRAAARDVDDEVELVRRFRQLQRLANDHAQRFIWEIPVERLVIDLDLAAAWPQIDSRGCRLSPSRSVILNFSHSNLSSFISGARLL